MKAQHIIPAILLLAVGSPALGVEFVFGPATHLGPPISSDAPEQSPFLSADGLSLYFDRAPSRPGGYLWDKSSLHVLPRPSVNVPFSGPARELNSGGFTTCPSLTADGLSLFYSSAAGPFDDHDMYEVTRGTTAVDFDFAADSVRLGPNVNYPGGWDGYGQISLDGLTLVWISKRPGGEGGIDLWMATRATRTVPFDPAENLGPPVNTSYLEGGPSLSSDGQALFFHSDRPGGQGSKDLWVSYRDDSGSWQEPINLGPDVNSASDDWTSMISADMSTLYFASTRPGGIPNHPDFPPFVPVLDIYQVSVTVVVEPVRLLAALSRKTHGVAGDFDIDLPLDGATTGLESRTGGPTTVVLTFSEPAAATDGVADCSEVTLSGGTCIDAVIVDDEMTIELADAPDAACLTLTVSGIEGLDANPLEGTDHVTVSVLRGDARPGGNVDIRDMSRVKGNLFQTVTEHNFRADVNADGEIDVADMSAVKGNLFAELVCP